jgi:protein O-mannosyl-transferase
VSRPRFIALLLVLGTLVVYLPVANHGFTLYDDGDYVTQNDMVQAGLTWAGVEWAFTTGHASNWHPLTWLSHMADCQVAGLNPVWPHCENVLLHAANAVLLFALLLQLTERIWPSAFVAALFAWHPLHVESVAWIAERKDVLSTFFALLTLLAYARYVQASEAQSSKFKMFYFSALLLFALGLLAKPMVVTLPFVMLLLDYWPLQRFLNLKSQVSIPPARQASLLNLQFSIVVEKLPFFALSAISCVITFLVQHHGGAVASLKIVPLDYRLRNLPVAYAGYLFKMAWPAHLAVFYPLNALPAPKVAAAAAVWVAISVLVWRARRAGPYWLVGWLWFLGTLVPVIGLVQVGDAAMADRYTYFPSVGIFLAVALGVRDAVKRFHIPKPIVGAVASLVLAACLALTHRQVSFWRNDVTLFRHAAQVTKDNDTAYLNLGYALEKAGRDKEAMAAYQASLKIDPDRVETHNNIANLLDDAGQPQEAEAQYLEALRINPNHVASHDNYGTLLVELGRFDEAMKQYNAAARVDPDDWHPPYLIGKLLLKEGRDVEAIPYFKAAVRKDPNNPRVLTYLAEVLASDENPKVRDGNAALAMAAKANDLTGGNQPVMFDVMAMAYAEIGQFTNAQKASAFALKLAAAYNMTNDTPVIQQRLQLYKDDQPFRQSFLSTKAPGKKPTREKVEPENQN